MSEHKYKIIVMLLVKIIGLLSKIGSMLGHHLLGDNSKARFMVNKFNEKQIEAKDLIQEVQRKEIEQL